MANSANVQWVISGVADLSAFLSDLKPSTQAKIIAKTMEVASKPIIQLAREKAPKKTGALAKSLGSITRIYPSKGQIVSYIGARRGYYTEAFSVKTRKRTAVSLKPGQRSTRRVTPANYSHLVEYGHRSVNGGGVLPNYGGRVSGQWNSVNKGRSIRKGTTGATSFVAPRPFLRPAFEQGKAFAEARVVEGFDRALEREFARAQRKFNKTIKLAA